MKEKMWALLVHLSMHYGSKHYEQMPFDEDVWKEIKRQAAEAGLNTIVLDLCDGIQYASHPEIAMPGAWTRKKVRDEIKECREKGITLIPKLNFATPHNAWLGEYSRMVSTNIYYKVCNDLIKEVYELFDHPEYIHLGMDEEDHKHVKGHEYVVYRQGELYWHDLRYILDCVRDTGAKPWIWSCPLFEHPEEYRKHIDADEAVLSPWYYNAFREEHYTPVSSRASYEAYYNQEEYAHLNIKFVEEDPFLVKFREVALPLMKEGYEYIPCASVVNMCEYNTMELLEYFKLNAPDNQIRGFITAPWCAVIPEKQQRFEESLRLLKEAKERFYL